ncbi:MAG: hypothetical protein ACI9JM_003455 [Halioglobus sp.]|jgi:hypothetical protein
MRYRCKALLLKIESVILCVLLAACVAAPESTSIPGKGKTICDTYLFMSMCVQDVSGDDTVDMVYFTDTLEIFMYQAGREDAVVEVMPFHRCAVPLDEKMQDTTNRILARVDMKISEEIAITRELIDNYLTAKPEIDACNAGFEDASEPRREFLFEDEEWEDE